VKKHFTQLATDVVDAVAVDAGAADAVRGADRRQTTPGAQHHHGGDRSRVDAATEQRPADAADAQGEKAQGQAGQQVRKANFHFLRCTFSRFFPRRPGKSRLDCRRSTPSC
jgi:hypothetical protein